MQRGKQMSLLSDVFLLKSVLHYQAVVVLMLLLFHSKKKKKESRFQEFMPLQLMVKPFNRLLTTNHFLNWS